MTAMSVELRSDVWPRCRIPALDNRPVRAVYTRQITRPSLHGSQTVSKGRCTTHDDVAFRPMPEVGGDAKWFLAMLDAMTVDLPPTLLLNANSARANDF